MTDLVGTHVIIAVVQVATRPGETPEQAAAWITRSLMLTAEAYARGAKIDVTVVDPALLTGNGAGAGVDAIPFRRRV